MNFEIERKFLILKPQDLDDKSASVSEITQTYLIADERKSERVRARKSGNEIKYTHTFKITLSDLTRIENEEEITEAEYNSLLLRRDECRSVIKKTRYCVPFKNQIFEIDVFPFWKSTALMEIELASEDTPFVIPDFIKVIREVTGDGAYTNASLAKSIPKEE